MSTTRRPRAARMSPSVRSVWPDDPFSEHVAGWVESDPDDVWPLELWMSREEALLDGDTWHAGRSRALGSLLAAVLRR